MFNDLGLSAFRGKASSSYVVSKRCEKDECRTVGKNHGNQCNWNQGRISYDNGICIYTYFAYLYPNAFKVATNFMEDFAAEGLHQA